MNKYARVFGTREQFRAMVEKWASADLRELLESTRPGSTAGMAPPPVFDLEPPKRCHGKPGHDERMRAAWRKFNAARRAGKIAKPELCSRCGAKPPPRALQGHHEDYDKPLEVVWLCLPCHSATHGEMRREGRSA